MEQTTTQKQAAVGKHGLSISRYTLAEGTAALAAQVKKKEPRTKVLLKVLAQRLIIKPFMKAIALIAKWSVFLLVVRFIT